MGCVYRMIFVEYEASSFTKRQVAVSDVLFRLRTEGKTAKHLTTPKRKFARKEDKQCRYTYVLEDPTDRDSLKHAKLA